MDERDRLALIARYESRLARHGRTPEALGWGKSGKQEIRFAVLAAAAIAQPESSVLDVGCGFADLYDFLVAHGWRGRYTGVDLVPGLLEVARDRHPQLELRELDITTAQLGAHDFVIGSGIANTALQHVDELAHVETLIAAMFAHANAMVAIDFLSTWVDFIREGAWHTDPAWALATAHKLTRRVALRHDYLPYEFALFLRRDDGIGEGNTFA
ncbi:MAG TPA: class I SAM-dependent methyltransferase [Thermoanaerobaculia bacterium]|nr:class I SAM-dependent methyltransferase [Thermoanaerobaculia bacterium]